MQKVFLDIILLIHRLGLGLYFLLAGVAKYQGGVEEFVDGPFTKMTPEWLPSAVARPYGFALPLLEIVFGAALMIGVFTRISAFAITGMLVSFLIVLIQAANHPDALQEGQVGSFHYNYLFVAIALAILLLGPGRVSIDALLFRRKPKAEVELGNVGTPSNPSGSRADPTAIDSPGRLL